MRLGPRALIVLTAVLFSTGGAGIKACALDPWTIACLRAGFAALALVAVLPAARRRPTARTLAVGVAQAATTILFVRANRLTTAAAAIFIQSSSPVFVLLLAPWLLRERVRGRDVAFMAVLAGGVALFFVGKPPVAATAPAPLEGNILSAVAALTAGLMMLGLRWLEREHGSAAAAVAQGNALACLVCLSLASPLSASSRDLLILAGLGTFQIASAFALLTVALRRLPAVEASLLLLLEPVLSPLWAFLVHGELPGAWASAGSAVIVGATAVKTWRDARGPEPEAAAAS